MSKHGAAQRGVTLQIILLVAFIAAILLLGAAGLNKLGLITLPSQDSTEQPEPVESGDATKLLAALASGDSGVSYLTIDDIGVRQILITSPASNYYFHEYSVRYSDAEDGEAYTYSVIRSDSDWDVAVFMNGYEISRVNRTGSALRYTVGGETTMLTGGTSNSFETVSGSVSALDLINFIINFGGQPEVWRFGEVLDCKVETVRVETVNMAVITLTYAGRTEEYVLDIDRGALLSAKSIAENKLLYSLETLRFSYDLGAFDIDSLFSDSDAE